MASIKDESKRRGLRKVKSLNLRKPEDLEAVAQGMDDLLDLMKLKHILATGEVFEDKLRHTETGDVLKKKRLLNIQAKSSSKLPVVEEDAAENKEKNSLKAKIQKKTFSRSFDKKKSSLNGASVDDVPTPEVLNLKVKRTEEWDDINDSHKSKFWEEHDIEVGEYHYGVAIKGWRDSMEDTFDIKTSISPDIPNLFGVYDGHGGVSCANFCKNFLLQQVAKNPNFMSNTSVILKDTFLAVDADYGQAFKDGTAGATATALVVVPIDVDKKNVSGRNAGTKSKTNTENPRFRKSRKMKETNGQKLINTLKKTASLRENKREFKYYCACVGDSRAILIYESGNVVPLSEDHNLRRQDELERIRQAEGEIRYDPEFNELLVYSQEAERGLNVTRTIGDKDFKPWVMALPEIHDGFLTSQAAYFVVASDGVWSQVRNKEVGDIILQYGLEEGLKNVANLTNKRGCFDNCTLVGVDIQKMLAKMNEKLDQ